MLKMTSWCCVSAISGIFGGGLFLMFIKYKMRYLIVRQKNNPLLVCELDRKIRPSRSPIVITRQASWCQSVILGTDYLFHPHTHDRFFYYCCCYFCCCCLAIVFCKLNVISMSCFLAPGIRKKTYLLLKWIIVGYRWLHLTFYQINCCLKQTLSKWITVLYLSLWLHYS